jgi:hypothetical protein
MPTSPIFLDPTDYSLFAIYRPDGDNKVCLVHRDHIRALTAQTEQEPGVIITDPMPLSVLLGWTVGGDPVGDPSP